MKDQKLSAPGEFLLTNASMLDRLVGLVWFGLGFMAY